MCGIAGYLGFDPHFGEKYINDSSTLMIHRGPDGFGFYSDEQVHFCHRRLAIQDLSEAGKQPMLSADGRYVLVFNGEIYNHLELREKYYPTATWRGHSDTETLLRLLVDLKEKCFEELVGMWALAFWDKETQKLLISRDRFGQKPLYWNINDKGIFFASEIKPLLSVIGTDRINQTAVVEYLALGNYGHLGEETFFKSIYQLPPSTYAYLSMGDSAVKPIKYWHIQELKESEKQELSNTGLEEIKGVVEEAVKSQLIADVKIGASLSGGIDSSIVVGILTKVSDATNIPIFTAQTQGSKWDESRYVRDVEKMWGTEKLHLIWKELSLTRISEQLDSVIGIQEEPFGDPSIIAHKFIMRLAKENNVKVLLGGQGADEMFLGYPSTSNGLMSIYLRSGYFKEFIANVKAQPNTKSKLPRIALGALSPNLERRLRMNSRQGRRSWIDEALLKEVNDAQVNLLAYHDVYDLWESSLYGTYLPHLVHYDDRNTMSESIEGRMPFLDHRIVEHLNKYKSKYFFQNGKYKSILRDSCKDYLPQSIIDRKDKIGFYTPLKDMIMAEKDWVIDVLMETKDLFHNTQSLIDAIRNHSLDYNSMLIVWRIISFEIWRKKFGVSL